MTGLSSTVTGNAPDSGTGVSEGSPTPASYALDPGWVSELTAHAVISPRTESTITLTPMNGRALARLPLSTVDDVAVAVEGARSAQRFWALLPVASRAQIVLRFHDLLLAHQVELLDLIQLESGKSRLDAFEEIVHAAQVSRFYARRAPSLLRARRRPGVIPGLTQVFELHQPVGVVGVVSPWGSPLSVGLTDAIPALLAGNAVVLRPDLQGSLTQLFCAELLARAGLPQRVVQVVLGDGPTIGQAVLDRVDYVCFTGSTVTGRQVAHHAAQRLVRVSLGLASKNPMYVAADADLDRAVTGAVRACFSAAGQHCAAIERLLLHERIATDFLERFLPAVRELRLGAALTYDADVGSLASAAQLERTVRHVEQARELGATVLVGGRHRPDIGPWFYEPTVLADVTEQMEVRRTETFGPVVSVFCVDGDAEAVRQANDSELALNASVWTRDTRRGRVLAAAIRAGSVDINEGYAAGLTSVAAAVGGLKDSGLGRRHGQDGIRRFTETKSIAAQRLVNLGVPPRMDPQRFAGLVTVGLRLHRKVGRS